MPAPIFIWQAVDNDQLIVDELFRYKLNVDAQNKKVSRQPKQPQPT